MEKIDTISWKIIDKYFQNNNLALVDHHISYDFFTDSLNSNKNIQRFLEYKSYKNKEEYE